VVLRGAGAQIVIVIRVPGDGKPPSATIVETEKDREKAEARRELAKVREAIRHMKPWQKRSPE
jgi:hypothetical protein